MTAKREVKRCCPSTIRRFGDDLPQLGSNLLRPRLGPALPEQQVSDWVAAVHRVEKIPDLVFSHTNGR